MILRTCTALVLALGLVTAAWAMPVEELAALDRLEGLDTPVLTNFVDVELSKVIGALAATAPFKVEFDGDVADRIVTVDLGKQSLRDVLIHLAKTYDLSYAVPEDGKLVVSKRES